jgi:bidirectional [NiFe] hydrogenase diaphorase subunit
MTPARSRITAANGPVARRRCRAVWRHMGAATASDRTLSVTLDGRRLLAAPGETVLEVARRGGVAIPTLCWLEGVSVWGGCRLCLVRVTGVERLQPACATTVADGMEVTTDSEELRDHRRSIVSLHLAEGNHICSVCVANGECELQEHATTLGVDHVEIGYRWPHWDVDASHERFVLDRNRCILCLRCVRVCAEVEGAHVWDVFARDGASVVAPGAEGEWGAAASCTSCGKCVEVCPTGALFTKGTAAGERHHDPDMIAALLDGRRRAARDEVAT